MNTESGFLFEKSRSKLRDFRRWKRKKGFMKKGLGDAQYFLMREIFIFIGHAEKNQPEIEY